MRFLRWLFTRIFWTSVVMLAWIVIGHSLEADSRARSHRQLIEQGKRWILEERASAEESRRDAEQQRRRQQQRRHP